MDPRKGGPWPIARGGGGRVAVQAELWSSIWPCIKFWAVVSKKPRCRDIRALRTDPGQVEGDQRTVKGDDDHFGRLSAARGLLAE